MRLREVYDVTSRDQLDRPSQTGFHWCAVCVRRPQVGKLGDQIAVRTYPIPRHFPFVITVRKASAASSLGLRPLCGYDAGRVGS
jgi:hypothetical protein